MAIPYYTEHAWQKKLGHDRISVIEFGVAGGEGLLALEKHAGEIEKIFLIKIDIYGFDLGNGLPQPIDYRDLPFYWRAGFFKMDVEKLKSRLSHAKLILGDVKDTVKPFFSQYDPAPIAAIMFDLDYYSATKAAFEIFRAEDKYLLPRIFCYFDDIIGTEECLLSETTGQRLAINEFNRENKTMRINSLHFLAVRKNVGAKYHRIRAFHSFRHIHYNTFIGPDNQQQPLGLPKTSLFI